MSREISADDLEKAERLLSRTYQVAVGASAADRIMSRARINREAAEKYIQYHRTILFRNYLPDIDPRQEPAITTMLLHFLCIGATAQRVADGRGDVIHE